MSNIVTKDSFVLRRILEEYLVQVETELYNLAMTKQGLEDGLKEVETKGHRYEKRMEEITGILEEMYSGEYLQ